MSFPITHNFSAFAGRETELAETIRDALDRAGSVLIEDFPVDPAHPASAAERFRALAGLVAEPIPHDAHGTIVWDIKTRPTHSAGVKTYSEHSHEAELHTDSQYSKYPEDYFALLTLRPAACGGGESLLLGLEDVLGALRASAGGARHEAALRTGRYPFLVPDVFKQSPHAEFEYNAGPILRDREIRFRVDTLEQALDREPGLCSAPEREAFAALKHIVLNSPRIRRFCLRSRDLVFINNKTMLHGRTAFTDPNRHLLRIRMNRRAR